MSSDDNDQSTEQVLEYYKKYSQNKNLSKYFSGTSISYLPPIAVENGHNRMAKNQKDDVHIENQPKIIINNSSPNTSSSESLSEHKKLEWDNGADIGYNSARKNSDKKLQKSSSLPILDSLNDIRTTLNLPNGVPSTIITHSTSNENVGVFVFSSSSTSNQESSKNSARLDPYSSSSGITESAKEQFSITNTSSTSDAAENKVSTSSGSDEIKFTDFQKTIDYLKHKIGLPGAHSTPNVDSQVTSVKSMAGVGLKPSLAALLSQDLGKKGTFQEKLESGSSKSNTLSGSFITQVDKSGKQKEVITKSLSSKSPSASPSRSPVKKAMKRVETKFIELSISTPINVNCKGIGDHTSCGRTPHEVAPKAVQTDSITHHHIETQFNFESNERKHKRPEILSISEDMTDLASSFEYISVSKNSAAVKVIKDKAVTESLVNKSAAISGVLKEISLSKSTTTSTSRTSCEEDIDKHLDLLQKLLKTKKINSRSRKKYIKKLLKQLSELETSTDSSSDLFIPKKDTDEDRFKPKQRPKVVFKEALVEKSLDFCVDQKHTLQAEKTALPMGQRRIQECQCIMESDSTIATNKLDKKLERKEAIEQEISNSDESKQHQLVEGINIGSMESSGSSKSSSSESKPSSTRQYTNSKMNDALSVQPIESLKSLKGLSKTDSNETELTTNSHNFPSSQRSSAIQHTKRKVESGNLVLDNINKKHILDVIKPSEYSKSSQGSSSSESSHRLDTSNIPNNRKQIIDDAGSDGGKKRHVFEHLSNVCICCDCHKNKPKITKSSLLEQISGHASDKSSKRNADFSNRSHSTDDFLLKFAENERTYQLNWINNEICHLSKLKNMLLKGKKPSKEPGSKTSVYSVVRRDGSNRVSERNYVIESGVNVPQEQGINYLLDGKEYVVSDSQKSSSDSDKAVIADIEVNLNENRTNIKLSTICSSCKHAVCVCSSGKTITSKMSSLLSEVKSCSACQQAVCQCKPGEGASDMIRTEAINPNEAPSPEIIDEATRPTSQHSEPELLGIQEDYNSLEKVFKKCCCTVENTNCGCDFVKKLLDKFRIDQAKIDSTTEAVQTDNLVKTDRSTSVEQKEPDLRQLRQEPEVQAGIGDKHISLQALKDVFSKSTQTQTTDHKDERSSTYGNIDLKHCACQTSAFDGNVETLSRKQTIKSMSNDEQTDQQKYSAETRRHSKEIPVQAAKEMLSSDVQTFYSIKPLESQVDGKVKESESGASRSVGLKNIGIQVLVARNEPIDYTDNKPKATVEQGTQYTKFTETSAGHSRSDNTSASGPTSMSDSRSAASSRITCCCCKQKAFLAEVSYPQEGNDSLAVCSRCYYNQARYKNQRLACRCRNYWYAQQSQDVCKCCRMEASKCLRRPHWLAYTVTLKKDGVNKRRRRSSKSSLENIKVQKGWSWKSLKNKENYCRKDDNRNKRSKKEKPAKEPVNEDKDDMEKDSYKKKGQKADKEDDEHYTLTEYLIKNKPEFICSAEYRRQMLLNSRILREQQKDALKLNFLENNLRNLNEGKFKLFTEREMKDINKKNYKKLPEIQEKLISQRENRLRHADRLISNIFAKKVQTSVLQGRGNFPIDKPLASL